MIEIRMTKCLLLLTEQEIQRLLAKEPELWKLALYRGKHHKRAQRFE